MDPLSEVSLGFRDKGLPHSLVSYEVPVYTSHGGCLAQGPTDLQRSVSGFHWGKT